MAPPAREIEMTLKFLFCQSLLINRRSIAEQQAAELAR
uniref:Uncharacterized protein n=1 Tax=Rheinheimera sp. BAL341 TaxID=1708203 RepID=A0A486XQJ0_9GAMM